MITKNLYLFSLNSENRLAIISNSNAPFIQIKIEKLDVRLSAWLLKQSIEIDRKNLIELKSFIDQLIKDFENED
jgi:hypothetical protein